MAASKPITPTAAGRAIPVTPSAAGIQAVTPGMRIMLFAASLLVFTVGIQLFILTEWTDRFFAWTIKPSITAAFLGGAYWASFILEFMAARERAWARARVAVPAVLTFTTLTLVATVLHLDKFHLNSPNLETGVATWAWIVVYASVPIILTVLLVGQLRVPGDAGPRQAPLPAALRLVLGVQAGGLVVLGLALFLAPALTLPIWPWALTPLTARAIGAWLLGLGIAAGHSAWENDGARVQPAMIGFTVFGVLQCLTLARYPGAVQWASPSTWIYLLMLAGLLAAGAYGWYTARPARAAPVGAPRPMYPG